MSAAVVEPAIKSYFFGKGYADLRNTIVESWTRNLESTREEFKQAGRLWTGSWGEKALAVLRGSAGVSVVLFGTLFFLAFSLLHVIVLGSCFLLIYAAFSLVYLAERGVLTWRRFFTVCPVCHARAALPEYLCGRCGAVHRRLIPSACGILRHRCTCGESLPATFFLRRSGLLSRCPECGYHLAVENTEARKVFLPVFGGPSVGKSSFLFAAIEALTAEMERRQHNPGFVEPRTESELARIRRQFAAGVAPDKTAAALPRAWNLRVVRDGFDPRLLYLYDPAGEAFQDVAGLAGHCYQRYLSGMVVLIDPFSIPTVRDDHAAALAEMREPLKPSSLAIEDVLSRIMISLEERYGLERTARLQVPVALVINKVDACGLDELVGEAAVRARMQASATPLTRPEARDRLLREQLIRWGQADLVQQLDARCSQVRYFTCSALGRTPDGSARPFAPRDVLEPLAWLLSVADPAFFPPPQEPTAAL